MRTALIAVTLTSFAATARAGQVRVVGPLPHPYQSLQDAVTDSANGDVILIKQGTYGTVRITDKNVALVAENGAIVNLAGAVRVRDIDPAHTVVLAGLKATGTTSTAMPELMSGLYGENCLGRIVVQDCELRGANAVGPCIQYLPRGGAELIGCAGVSFARCTLVGNIGSWTMDFPNAQGPGLRAQTSAVSFDQGLSVGSYGGTVCSGYQDGSSSGHGAELRQSSLYSFQSTFRGPDGIPAPYPPQFQLAQVSGSGGHGIRDLLPPQAQLRMEQTTLQFGIGGASYTFSCLAGQNGLPLANFAAGTVTTVPAFVHALSGPRLVRDDQWAEFRIDAQPGAKVEIALSRATTFVDDPASLSIQHLENPHWGAVGVVPPGGNHVTRRMEMPDLPLANPGQVYYLQARVTAPTGERRLTNVHAVAIVDASY